MLKTTQVKSCIAQRVVCALGVTAVCLALAAPWAIEAQEVSSVERAKALWEKVIAAKGGREKMLEIESILKIEKSKKARVHFVDLTVFPGKGWSWADYRPGKLGLALNMENSETGAQWILYHVDPDSPQAVQFPYDPTFPLVHLWEVLETRWAAPEPYRVERETVGSRRVDVLYARIGKHFSKYFLDPDTLLPFRIDSYMEGSTEPIRMQCVRLYDYIEVDGIMVPSGMRINDSKKLQVTYHFNVDYDPNIFLQPPSIEAGPDAWMPKTER